MPSVLGILVLKPSHMQVILHQRERGASSASGRSTNSWCGKTGRSVVTEPR